MTTPLPLAAEREALSRILERLMSEEISLDNLCKHAPRIISVAANVARIQSGLEAASSPWDMSADIRKAYEELTAEVDDNEVNAW